MPCRLPGSVHSTDGQSEFGRNVTRLRELQGAHTGERGGERGRVRRLCWHIGSVASDPNGAGSMRVGKRRYEAPTVFPGSLRVPTLRPGMATPERLSSILSSSEGI